jgi:hypothetical protein
MGEFTQHNGRPVPVEVRGHTRTLRNGAARRSYFTLYSRRCTRCGCGLKFDLYGKPQRDQHGRVVTDHCPGRQRQ